MEFVDSFDLCGFGDYEGVLLYPVEEFRGSWVQ